MIRMKASIFKTLEIFIIVFVSVTPLLPRAVSIGLYAALLSYSVFLQIRKNGRPRISQEFVLLLLFFLIPMALDLRNVTPTQIYSGANLLFPFYFVCGYFIAQKYEKQEFYKIFERIVFVCAALSLIGMAICLINPQAVLSFPEYTFNGNTHRTLVFSNFLFVGEWMAVRNCGIAWEPGVFQILLSLAFQIAIQKYEKWWLFVRVAVYTVAGILTRSTLGYLMLLVNIVTLVIKHRKYLYLVLGVTAVCLPFVFEEVVYQIQYKLFGSSAFSARFTPLINAVKISWNRLFGVGSTFYDAFYQELRIGSYDSYTQILLRFGYPVLLYVLYKLFRMLRRDSWVLALILAIGFLSEPIWSSLFVVVFYFVSDPGKKEVEAV